MRQVARQDFIKYHLKKAVLGAFVEAVGNEDLSRCLHAQTKLRLISMSDEELLKLAKLTASPPERPVELVYKEFEQVVKKLRATAGEWINDLRRERYPTRKGRMSDRILTIEGEPALGRKLTSALTKAGFTAACVPDYLEALLKLDEFKPDMVIVDEGLQSGDGMEACFHFHETFGIPVILLGKDYSEKAWKTAVETGADFYFRKPFKNRELVARVKAILRRYKRPQESGGEQPISWH